jgi:predicted TIM-barrel fold metal-dependent hydrolase
MDEKLDRIGGARVATRREVATGLAALGGAALLPAGARLAAAQAPHRRIDVHHHFASSDVLASGRVLSEIRNWTVERSLDDMEKGGVTTAMLSTVPQVLEAMANGGPITGVHCRAANEFGAQLVADHRGRFGLFAAIPLTDTDASLKELAYAFDVLKADGIGLFTSYGNQWLGNPVFDPVFAELNRRKAVVYTHPTAPLCCANLIKQINVTEIEYGTDTTRAIANMVFSGASQRFPDLRMIFSHGGGTMPFLIRRFLKDAKKVPAFAQALPNGFLPEARRFYYDIAQVPIRAPLLALKDVAPVSHLLFGTDYPYLTATEHVDGMKEARVFSSSELRAIDDNALRLLPRLRA